LYAKRVTDPANLPTLSVTGFVASLRLNAPGRHNALSAPDIVELRRLLEEVRERSDLRVLIFRAAGKSFCSGHDLGHFKVGAGGVPAPVEFAALADALETLPLPVICALQGSVYAGGIDLALACDFRIGVHGIRTRLPAADIGIHLYPGALRRYVSRIGLSAAKRLCLLGETLDAIEMQRVGFLDRVVDPTDLEGAVESMAAALARGGPLAVRGMKSALNAYAAARADDALVEASYRGSFASQDILEGLLAQKERRDPVFAGR
jgi:enoyl-CoA hydratase